MGGGVEEGNCDQYWSAIEPVLVTHRKQYWSPREVVLVRRVTSTGRFLEGAGLPPRTLRGRGRGGGKRWGLFAEEGAVVGEGLAGEERAVGGAKGKEERAFGEGGKETCRRGSALTEGLEIARCGEAFDEVALEPRLRGERADLERPLREVRIGEAHQREVHLVAR